MTTIEQRKAAMRNTSRGRVIVNLAEFMDGQRAAETVFGALGAALTDELATQLNMARTDYAKGFTLGLMRAVRTP